MKTKKFWNWTNQEQTETAPAQRILTLNGTIAEESWFDDDVTPQLFKDDLMAGTGDVTVWINSPGGDCIAAAQIYTMLKEYPGKVTVKIDGMAASAASVVAMAGDSVLMSPVSMMMIHNPATGAWGDYTAMEQAIAMLDEVKESILNAYVIKSGQSRAKLSHLMDAETWMNANKAVELGLADGILGQSDTEPTDDKAVEAPVASILFSSKSVENALMNKMAVKYGKSKTAAEQAHIPNPKDAPEEDGVSTTDLRERLTVYEKMI